MAFGAALAFVAGLSTAACGQGEAPDSTANAVPQAAEVSQTAQTTPATQPVVTVYKSPT
jgi:F0F1-type ATP synthase membrane subunit c/vacuolar-type H+-ATPase subunit K